MEANTVRTGAFPESGPSNIQQSPPRDASIVLNTDAVVGGIVMTELIVDKLKLLDYERQFCNSRSPPWPRLHKFYFAFPSSNRNEQYIYFSTMAAWLFTLLGFHFPAPSEADDPDLTCSKIMKNLISLGFSTPNWPPALLKQGHGDAVCTVLDTLCSLVLNAIKYEFKLVTNFPTAPSCNVSHNDHSKLKATDQNIEATPHAAETSIGQTATLNPSLITNKKKLEVERIAPSFQIEAVANKNDWQAHLERAKKLYDETTARVGFGKAQLKKFEEGVMSSMEMLESQENFINQELEGLISDYVAVKGRLVGVEAKCNGIREVTRTLAEEHGKVLEALGQVKQKMVEKGNEIADLSPLLQMKAAIQRLRLELREMEVKIGVMEHSLLQVSIQQAKGGNTEDDNG